MNENEKDLSCADFQAQLPDLIETGDEIGNHPHVQSCELCRAFLADIEAIASAARTYFGTIEEPPDRIWDELQSKIKEESGGGENHLEPALGDGPGSTGTAS